MEVLESGSIAWIGASGSLFSINDILSGSLMSVNDISGIPILEVFSDDTIVMGQYGTNALYVTGSKVGIGTIPGSTNKLRILSSGNSSYPLMIKASNDQNLGFLYEDADGDAEFYLYDQTDVSRVVIHTNGSSYFTGGNVGIGTTSPSAAKLHLYYGAHPGTEGLIINHDTTASGRSAGLTFGLGAYRKAGIELYDDGSGNGVGDLRFLVDSNTDAANVVSADVKMTLTNEGYVGIGTDNPSFALDIRKANASSGSTFDGTIQVSDITSGVGAGPRGGIILSGVYNTANSQAYFARISSEKSNATDGNYSGDLTFSTRTSGESYLRERMRILYNGYVGIGTSVPAQSLDVLSGTANSSIVQFSGTQQNRGLKISTFANGGFTDAGVDINAQHASGHINIQTAGSDVVSITSAGNVGIGTTSPDEILHVQKDQNDDTVLKIENNTAGTLAQARLQLTANSGFGNLSMYDDGYSNSDFADKLVLWTGTSGHGDIKINTRGNGDIEFATTGDTTEVIIHSGSLQTPTFVDGFAGSGYQLSSGSTNSLTLDNLTVRGTMSIYELLINQVRATNGALWVTSTGKAAGVTGAGPYTISFDDGQGYGHNFAVGDLIRAQRWDPNNSSLYQSNLTVTSITGTGSLIATATGDAPVAGMEYVRIGNDGTDTNRQGSIFMTSDDVNAPYLAVIDDVDSHTIGVDDYKVVVGLLDQVASAGTFTIPTGTYGMYASGSIYLEGKINATEGGYIAGWTINSDDLSSPGNSIVLGSTSKRITINDGTKDRIYLGEVDGGTTYGLKIFDGVGIGTTDGNLLVELGQGGNVIAGWEISGSRIHKYNGTNGGLTLDAENLRYDVYTGSANYANGTIVRMGDLDGSNNFGIMGYDTSGTELFKLGMLGNVIAGWEITQGTLQYDDAAGSIALDATNQALSIYTGSIDTAKPKVVMGLLPAASSTEYGFAVFSGSADANIDDDNTYSVLVTKTKARLAGWDMRPGELESGTVAKISGVSASIALGTGATTAGATPTPNLFFVSASSSPVFYVGENFSYVNDTLTAAGWTIDTDKIHKNGFVIDSTNDMIATDSGSDQRVVLDGANNVFEFYGDGDERIIRIGENFLGGSSGLYGMLIDGAGTEGDPHGGGIFITGSEVTVPSIGTKAGNLITREGIRIAGDSVSPSLNANVSVYLGTNQSNDVRAFYANASNSGTGEAYALYAEDGLTYFHSDVGIGTADPGSRRLKIYGDDSATPLQVDSLGVNTIANFNSSDNCGRIAIADDDTTAYFGAEGSFAFMGQTSTLDDTNFWVDGSGRVGIGVTNTGFITSSLTIRGHSASFIAPDAGPYTQSLDFFYSNPPADSYVFRYAGLEAIRTSTAAAGSGASKLLMKAGAGTGVISISGSNGYVGIGTEQANYRCQIYDEGAAGGLVIYDGTDDTLRLYRDSNIGFLTRAGDNTKGISIDNNGYVGIGTTNPGQSNVQLIINQTSATTSLPQIWLKNTVTGGDTGIYFNGPTNNFFVGVDDSQAGSFNISDANSLGSNQRVTILAGGNVGIGSTNPGEKLDVNGDVSASGYKGSMTHVFFASYNNTLTGKYYVPWNSTTEATTIGEEHKLVMPYDGQVKKISLRMAGYNTGGQPGDIVVVGFHKASDGTSVPSSTATESENFSMVAAHTTVTNTFSTSTFSAGDVIAISVDPLVSLSPGDVNLTLVVEFDVDD